MRLVSLLFWAAICLVLLAGIAGGIGMIVWSLFNPSQGADLFSLMVLPGLFALLLPKARKRFTLARRGGVPA